MPQFVIERDLPEASQLTETDIREISHKSLQVLREMGSDIQWIQSFVTNDKIYCIYYAPEEELIREHARRAGLRVDRISAVRRLIDPSNLP